MVIVTAATAMFVVMVMIATFAMIIVAIIMVVVMFMIVMFVFHCRISMHRSSIFYRFTTRCKVRQNAAKKRRHKRRHRA